MAIARFKVITVEIRSTNGKPVCDFLVNNTNLHPISQCLQNRLSQIIGQIFAVDGEIEGACI